MPTIRQITSEILTDINSRNIDEYVSRRYIYSKLKDKAKTFIKQENASKLWKQLSLFVSVPCVQMKTVPLVDCCNVHIPNCTTVQRSILKLPKLYETTYGKYLIQVRNSINTLNYTPTTALGYQSLKLQEYQDPDIRYFWIENDYLIIPDSEVEIVTIYGLFPEPDEARKLNSCASVELDECKSILDSEFICPDYLLSVVKDATLQSIIAAPLKRTVEDQKPNMNSNERN